MKIKGILVGGAAIAAAAALTFGGFALANQGEYVPPTEPVASTSPAPVPTVTLEPTVEPTPSATPSPTAEPAPPAPAPAPAPKAAPVIEPPAATGPSAIHQNWPHFVAMVPQPPTPAGMEGYQLTADGTIWFKGCGEGEASCSWSTN